MARSRAQRTYRIVVGVLALLVLGILGFIGVVLVMNLPPSPAEIAATLTALPSPVATLTPTPTPVPTLAGVTPELLVCQRDAGQAMNDREMVGAVNISDDHLFLLSWLSREWQIQDLDDALPGVIMGFDVALDVWDGGCAVYDRVQIAVYDRREEQQTLRLNVYASMDDLLKWRAGELGDSDLIARLQVQEPSSRPDPDSPG